MKYIMMLLVAIVMFGCNGPSSQEKLAEKGYTFIMFPKEGNNVYRIYKDSTNTIWAIKGEDLSKKVLISKGTCEPCKPCTQETKVVDNSAEVEALKKMVTELKESVEGEAY